MTSSTRTETQSPSSRTSARDPDPEWPESRLTELRCFFPRVAADSAELLHRWEMHQTPPDILITNYSMLQTMLMRHADPALANDVGDGDIIEQTRVWLQQPANVFTIVVDELHLNRGAAGTEAAYLLRLLLKRLGLTPDHPQLRILASSASLATRPDELRSKSLRFLSEFWGVAEQSRFRIVEGTHRPLPDLSGEPSIPAPALGALADFLETSGAEIDPEVGDCASLLDSVAEELGLPTAPGTRLVDLGRGLVDAWRIGDRLTCASSDASGASRPRRLSSLAADLLLFGNVASANNALHGLFVLLQSLTGASLGARLPRFRLHGFYRNLEGLWAGSQTSRWRRAVFRGAHG